jgi:hypothetical protein
MISKKSVVLAPERLETVADDFRQFGTITCRHLGSPLYEQLSLAIAEDPDLLYLASYCHCPPIPHSYILYGS